MFVVPAMDSNVFDASDLIYQMDLSSQQVATALAIYLEEESDIDDCFADLSVLEQAIILERDYDEDAIRTIVEIACDLAYPEDLLLEAA